MSERTFLEDAVQSVADGTDIDWAAIAAGLDSDDDRRLLEQLKILARIAEVHRAHASDAAEQEPAVRRHAPAGPERQ
jgi:hypothetical protein